MEKDGECKCVYPFDIRCTKLYVKYGEGMLCYCSIPIYPNSIYMIVLNVLHSPRRKLSMKLQPHLPVQCDCTPTPRSSLLSSHPISPRSPPCRRSFLFRSLSTSPPPPHHCSPLLPSSRLPLRFYSLFPPSPS